MTEYQQQAQLTLSLSNLIHSVKENRESDTKKHIEKIQQLFRSKYKSISSTRPMKGKHSSSDSDSDSDS